MCAVRGPQHWRWWAMSPINRRTHICTRTTLCWAKTFYKTCKIFHLLGLYKFILLILAVSHTTDISAIFFLLPAHSEHSNPFHEFFPVTTVNTKSQMYQVDTKWCKENEKEKIINFCNSMFRQHLSISPSLSYLILM